VSILIGLTGGIGSGKSLAASYFREQGAKIIDADIISRQVVESGQPAWKEIVGEFGAGYLNPDQSLNREKLATEVFQNEKKRTVLERIVHPRIFSEEKKRYEEYSKSDSRAIVIIDAALLIESGNYKNVDKVVIVKTSLETQIERVMQRNGISREEVENRLKSQMPLEEKSEFADYILDNECSREELKSQVSDLHMQFKGLA